MQGLRQQNAGLQDHFDWRSVAASGMAAGVGYAVGQALNGTELSAMAQKMVRGAIAGSVSTLVRGGKLSFAQLAQDAFGQVSAVDFAHESLASSGAGSTPYSAEEMAGDYAREANRFASAAALNREEARLAWTNGALGQMVGSGSNTTESENVQLPSAFASRLYDNANIEVDLARKLNLYSRDARLQKMGYVDPMGGIWGSASDTEIQDPLLARSLVPSLGTPNKYEGYDLSTAEGMKNFLVDVSLARKLRMQLPDEMLATAKTIGSTYFGETGSIDQTTRNVLRANDQILSDRFATNTGRLLLYLVLNDKFGTTVDFAAVSQFEGGQRLNGYVPKNRDGQILGKSGVTIATAFDIGQMNESQLNELGLGATLEERLRPYTRLTKTNADRYLDSNPLSVTRAEAMEIDFAVKAMHLGSAIQSWNNSNPMETFTELTRAQQTVIFSRTFHQGVGMPMTVVAQEFYTAARQGLWVQAESALREYHVSEQWYKNRVAAEANLLLRERSK